ncbi:Organic radical activating enzyme [Nitrospirillum viridazoti Y2]|nr:Organic radical activating enzyme [Nitrospirillum amazonense Y2]
MDGDRGGRYLAEELANTMACLWPQETTRPLAVMTGGEPLLQLDSELIHALHARGFEIAVETNGTIPIPGGVDWVCVSPKSATMLSVVSGDELKIVYPQKNLPPEALENMEFNHKILQPMDGPEREKNLKAAIAYCLAHPRWRLSLQTHKIIGIR